MSPAPMYQSFFKRVLDLVMALVALIVLAPVILATAVVVRFTLGSPVLFRQARPGRRGIPFNILKFRTMRMGRAGDDDASRLTPVGRTLRGLSLDELPELWNVLKGDMSLVGPRPLRMEYLSRYTSEQSRRHHVRPGISGLAQINGRNTLDWETKFKMDVRYVDTVSFSLDLRILCVTVLTVVKRSGISSDGHATAPEFLGSSTRH
jgi:lipopolysaccharide/colanic/teichoic acid biosynthesis glycosyltransferase